MGDTAPSDVLRQALDRIETVTEEERLVVLAYLAGQDLQIDDETLNAAIRRAQLLLATGGDPRRALEPGGRAVSALAEDLDDPARRKALDAGFAGLVTHSGGLPRVTASIASLRAEPDSAWEAFAAAILADSLE